MALTITKTDSAPLTIQGTNIALTSIYARLELQAFANGVDMVMGMYYYEDAAAFEAGSSVVAIAEMQPQYSAQADISEGETQTVLLASEKVKEALEAQGYTVEIVDL
jgi:hypothetical protein